VGERLGVATALLLCVMAHRAARELLAGLGLGLAEARSGRWPWCGGSPGGAQLHRRTLLLPS
jgi:hypothetical protein